MKKCIEKIKKIENIKSIIIIIVLIVIIIVWACIYKSNLSTTQNNLNSNPVEATTEKVVENINIESVVKITDTISVTYTWSLEDGTIFDASSNHPNDILSFQVGALKVIPWFDNGVIGMKLWETRTIIIAAADAYGETNEVVLTDGDFAAIEEGGLKKEDMVVWLNEIIDGSWSLLWEIEIFRIEEGNYYARHPNPLAGSNLIFQVTIDTITPFTEKETVNLWDNISVIYTGTLEDGTIFDTNNKEWGKPLEFTAWAGEMIPWFDAGVMGMKLWETKTITIPAAEAYGEEWDHELAWKDLTFEITIESIR